MNKDCYIGLLEPEALKRALQDEDLEKLKELSERGINLNPWQANMLFLGGRMLGKTELAYVQIAELAKSEAITVNRELILKYDRDIVHWDSVKLFIRGLNMFIEAHYSDCLETNLGNEKLRLKPTSYRWFE